MDAGRFNQAELSERIDPLLASTDGQKLHSHNQLIAAIYGNVTREMPDQGLAPWVSANDKPSAPVGTKPVSGDAAERRLKGDVMQLPSRDRRRIKDLIHNEVYQTASQLARYPPSPFAFLTNLTRSSIRMTRLPVSSQTPGPGRRRLPRSRRARAA